MRPKEYVGFDRKSFTRIFILILQDLRKGKFESKLHFIISSKYKIITTLETLVVVSSYSYTVYIYHWAIMSFYIFFFYTL